MVWEKVIESTHTSQASAKKISKFMKPERVELNGQSEDWEITERLPARFFFAYAASRCARLRAGVS